MMQFKSWRSADTVPIKILYLFAERPYLTLTEIQLPFTHFKVDRLIQQIVYLFSFIPPIAKITLCWLCPNELFRLQLIS